MTEITVPYSEESERAVIGSVLLDRSALDEFELRPDDFHNSLWRACWEVFEARRARGEQSDVLSVADELRRRNWTTLGDGRSVEETLVTALDSARPAILEMHAAEVVRNYAKLRRVIQLSSTLLGKAQGYADVTELLSEARSGLAEIDQGGTGGPTSAGDAIEEAIRNLQEKAKNPEKYFTPTGIATYDNLTGGLQPGRLVCVAARPGMGKTALAGTWAINASVAGVPTLVISLEMDRQELLERFLASLTGIDGGRLEAGRLREEHWRAIQSQAEYLKKVPLYVDDRHHSIHSILSTARTWRNRMKARYPHEKRALIEVDYVGLIKASTKHERRDLEVGSWSGALKMLAKELQTPVVMLSQLNRAIERDKDPDGNPREPQLSDLKDSGSLEADSNVVVFPHHTNAPINGDSSGPAKLIIAKNRGSKKGAVECYWDALTTTFRDGPRRIGS